MFHLGTINEHLEGQTSCPQLNHSPQFFTSNSHYLNTARTAIYFPISFLPQTHACIDPQLPEQAPKRSRWCSTAIGKFSIPPPSPLHNTESGKRCQDLNDLFLVFGVRKGKRNNQNIHLPYCEHQIVAKFYQHGQQEQNAHIHFHIRYTVSELHEYVAVFKHLPPLRLGAINAYRSSSFHELLIEQKVTLPGSNGSQAEKKAKKG